MILAFKEFLLPTMPQDDLEDVKHAIISSVGKVKGADNTPAYYSMFRSIYMHSYTYQSLFPVDSNYRDLLIT